MLVDKIPCDSITTFTLQAKSEDVYSSKWNIAQVELFGNCLKKIIVNKKAYREKHSFHIHLQTTLRE